MVVYILYIMRDVNLWLFGHSERPFCCRNSPPIIPPAGACLNFNPDGSQWLEAIRGIVLMLLNLFLPIALVILGSPPQTSALSVAVLAADRRPGPGLLP
jgi:hypothetical protein